MGDLGVHATMEVIEDLKKKVKENHIKEPADCKQFLIDSIKEQMDVGEAAYEFEDRTSVVLIIGVNGVGKRRPSENLPGNYGRRIRKLYLQQQIHSCGSRRAT